MSDAAAVCATEGQAADAAALFLHAALNDVAIAAAILGGKRVSAAPPMHSQQPSRPSENGLATEVAQLVDEMEEFMRRRRQTPHRLFLALSGGAKAVTEPMLSKWTARRPSLAPHAARLFFDACFPPKVC